MKLLRAVRSAFFLSLLCSVVGAVDSAAAKDTSRLNVLFIIADDLATRLGCYGDKVARTPSIDRLAAEGVLFNRAYCQGAVCTASRTSFMLGLNSRHANANHFLTHPETMSMGRWFRESGYQTCSIGKIDHDDPTDSYVDPRAWDVRVKREDLAPKAGIRRLSFDEDLGLQRKRVSLIGVAESSDAIADSVRTDRMLMFLDNERDAAKPFFAAIGFHAPHVPWDSTMPVFESFDLSRFALDTTPGNASALPAGSMLQEPGMEMSESRQREGQRGYYAAVTMLDQQVGRLMDYLRSRGLLENTVVVFTSDHGYHLGWRGQWCKHSIDEQVLRVPLIVRHPQGAKGARAEGIVELLDLFPSFCDIAGEAAPVALDGKSFLPMIKDPRAYGKEAAFCQWGNGRTVRTQRWRFTERSDGTSELYDHSTDDGEFFNVGADSQNASVAAGLRAMLDKQFGMMRPASKPNRKRSNSEPIQ